MHRRKSQRDGLADQAQDATVARSSGGSLEKQGVARDPVAAAQKGQSEASVSSARGSEGAVGNFRWQQVSLSLTSWGRSPQ